MKIFKDKSLREAVTSNTLDLELVEGGSTRKYIYHILNDHQKGEIRNLKVVVDNKEIEILKCPTTIGINEVKEFEFQWKADIKIEEGIRPKWKFTYDIICGPPPG